MIYDKYDILELYCKTKVKYLPPHLQILILTNNYRVFLATLVALHFTPVSEWVSGQSFGLA